VDLISWWQLGPVEGQATRETLVCRTVRGSPVASLPPKPRAW